ncbi:MAG: septation protein A [Gammaproteobacteria bacterium]|nr:septation protein A [Gammaproteobacteria bacterium]
MKFLFDFFPVIVFYIAYTIGKRVTDEVQSMVIATALLIAATCIQVGVTWVRKHKVEKMHIIVLALAIIFGGATIYFRDPAFLIWKVTLAYWLFAMAFLASHYIGEAPIIKRMMQHAIELPEIIWTRVSYMWILFFAAIGIVNLIIARSVSFDAWVNFKLFGTFGLTLVFVIIQSLYLARHAKEKPAEGA